MNRSYLNRPTCIALLMRGCMLLLIAGCHAPAHEVKKAQSEQHWNEVRAGIKLQLAQDQYASGSFEAAAKTASEAIILDPTAEEGYVILVRSALEQSNMTAAERALVAANAAGIRSSDLCYAQGVIRERQERYEDALELYATARVINPRNVDALVAEAECLAATHRPEDAYKLVTQQISAFEHDAGLTVLAGHLAELIGDTKAAIRWYAQAMLATENDPLVAEAYGLLLVQDRRYGEAVGVLSPLIPDDDGPGDHATVRRALATCYVELGNPRAVRNVLAPYLRIRPDDVAAQVLMAKAGLAANDIPTAIRSLDIAQREDPTNAEAWFVRAVAEWQRKDYDQAIQILERLIETRPGDVEAHCLLAESLLAAGKRQPALARFRHALRIDPGCAWAANRLRELEGHASGA